MKGRPGRFDKGDDPINHAIWTETGDRSAMRRIPKVQHMEFTQAIGRFLKPLGLLPLARLLWAHLSRLSPMNIRHRREMRRFYAQFVRKGDLVFDVGANVGNRTEVFVKLGARVVCVEPQESCIRQLRKLFGNNDMVTIVDKALGESDGLSELLVCEDANTISTMSEKFTTDGPFADKYTWTRRQPVNVTTLDALVRQYGVPKFCKIDVEGYETHVIKGLSTPVPVISFEFHRELLEDTRICMKSLSSLGQVQFNCSSGESMKLLYESWMGPEELCTRLEAIVEDELWGDIYARFL